MALLEAIAAKRTTIAGNTFIVNTRLLSSQKQMFSFIPENNVYLSVISLWLLNDGSKCLIKIRKKTNKLSENNSNFNLLTIIILYEKKDALNLIYEQAAISSANPLHFASCTALNMVGLSKNCWAQLNLSNSH